MLNPCGRTDRCLSAPGDRTDRSQLHVVRLAECCYVVGLADCRSVGKNYHMATLSGRTSAGYSNVVRLPHGYFYVVRLYHMATLCGKTMPHGYSMW
jgi:hypothetical protein